ncbi:diol dehydratase small subunit [Tessaracoccus sp. OH4464_COT-324]|uniref:diol dehydratase small subunit n=1 Tax=Tessaracoccus sp. OH4464_COT-324 TaxID=2491059 RepID=UPI000F62F9A1|nr:diol dehydratase small subunit [Tessaracoccus sp. OH4464_COT-324]RRD47802.1 diol dehydratase small subunit [Tessaracoccus sp. OH4464_COT-324]
MDQEQLIRQIMAEVMKDLGQQQVSFQKKEPAGTPGRATKVSKEHYPLAEKHPEMVSTPGGLSLTDLEFDKVKAGTLSPSEFRITPETLELQAQVADDTGRAPLARNMRRAAELVAVPDERLLEIYNALRPYRSTKAELYAIADELDQKYQAKVSAGFVRQAADVYEQRDRLRID